MTKLTVMFATAAVTLVAAAVAAATTMSLPSFRTHLIVPNRSIGGVTLKAGAASAERALGAAGRSCSPERGCSYGRDGATFSVVFAQLTTHSKPIVAEVTMTVAEKFVHGREVAQFDTPLTALKTSSGIGLGSTLAALKRAYPQAKGDSGDVYLTGSGGRTTTFAFAGGRVSSIAMQGVHVG